MGFRPSAKMVRLTPLRLLSAALVVALVFVASTAAPYAYAPRGYDTYTDTHTSPDTSTAIRFGRDCSPFASGALHDVTFVLRLSPAHAPHTLPALTARLARCHQDLLVFSPRARHGHGHDDDDDDDDEDTHDDSRDAAVDPLAHLRPEYRWGNADFDVYDRLHADNASDHATPDAYRLDKYTFLPMMEWAAYLRPDARWFVFVEPHTYLNHDNLYRFLARFNPDAPHYLGAPVAPTTAKYKKTPYAHPGSGFVLSRGALNKLMARGRMFAENHLFPGTHFFGENAADAPSGEQLLAHVLKKSGVPLRGYWPMFNDANPSTIRFGHNQWCDAVLTLHQLAPLDFSALARCDAARPHPERPLLFQHLFALIEPHLQPRVDDWTNLSDDTTFKPGTAQAKSFDACQRACLKDAKCLQYELSGGTCALSYSVRLGVQRLRDGEQASTAGWMMERISAFKAANSPCLGARFVHPRP
jgi:hypothetical protein